MKIIEWVIFIVMVMVVLRFFGLDSSQLRWWAFAVPIVITYALLRTIGTKEGV